MCRSGKRVGEEISRLQQATELFKAAQSRSSNASLFEEFAHRAQRNLIETRKDNDMIYNEMIPDIKTLELPGKAQLAKAMPLPAPQQHLSAGGKDIFAALVPVALHQAITASDARKSEFVNAEVLKLREATQTLNGVLASLNLPAAIEVTDCGSVPPSLLEKAGIVQQKGGIDSVRTLITELPEQLKRNREILNECERMCNEERDSDNQLRAQFKERWTRTPSEKLTESFRLTLAKYGEVINNAVQVDKAVRTKFDQHSNGMEILSNGQAAIESAMPSGSGGNVSNCSSTKRLRQLMESVETVKAERDAIESELKSATIDMKDQFLQALAQDGAINEPVLSVTHIGKTLGPLQTQVADSIARQASLINEIQVTHKDFSAETGAGTNSRDKFLSELAASFDNFVELQNNLNEGTKFYNDLTQVNLIQFSEKYFPILSF